MSPPRPVTLAALAAGGAALLLISARWTGDIPRHFVVAWPWAELAVFGPGEAPGGALTLAAAVVAAFGLGFLCARAIHRRLAPAGAPLAPAAVLLASLACFLALNPGVLPFVLGRGPESARGYLDVEDQLRGLGAALLVLIAMALMPKRRGAAEPVEPSRHALLLPCLVAALLPSWVSDEVLGGHPVTNDEVAYRYQAELFAEGRVAAEPHGAGDFFTARQVHFGTRVFSKYPPAHSLALAVGERLGDRRLLVKLLGAMAVFWTWALARRLGCREPLTAAWLVAASPMVVGVLGLDLSHGTSLPLGTLFLLASVRALDRAAEGRRDLPAALVAGAALSVVLAARPITAVALFVPVAVELLARRPRGWPALLGAAALGAAPAVTAFAWINRELTGSFFETAYELYARTRSADDRYGWVNRDTALAFTGFNASRLCWWLHGSSAGLFLLVIGLAWGAPLKRAGLLVSIPLSLLAFYALHAFHGIPWVGPLYLVEAVPAMAVTSAQGVAAVRTGLGSPRARVLLAGLAVSAALTLAAHLEAATERVALRRAPQEAAAEAGIEGGVVFVAMEDAASVKRFALLPPESGAPLVFAVDRGARNRELVRALGAKKAWRYVPAEGRLVAIPTE